MKSEKPKNVDQKPHRKWQPVCDFIMANREIFSRQGSVVATWRTYHGRRMGPYFRLAYRDSGRQRSVYLGRSRELADRVREMLHTLQAPLAEHRKWNRLRAQARVELRRVKSLWAGELANFGLHLKGYEIRGWRNADRSGSPGQTPLPAEARTSGAQDRHEDQPEGQGDSRHET